jgi:hypothetical protein
MIGEWKLFQQFDQVFRGIGIILAFVEAMSVGTALVTVDFDTVAFTAARSCCIA